MIALGSHVTFTYRAAVGRRHRTGIGENRTWEKWEIVEPRTNSTLNGGTLTVMTCVTPILFSVVTELVELDSNKRRRYPVKEERWDERNKTIFQWPQEGSGVVVGQVRRQYGISHEGRGEYDQGYFEAFGQVSLYVIKSELRGPQVYVPEAGLFLVHPS